MKDYLTIKCFEPNMDTYLNQWAAKGWTPEFITSHKDKILLTFSKEKEEKQE